MIRTVIIPHTEKIRKEKYI